MLILRRWNKVNKIQMSGWEHKAKVHLIVLNSTWHLLDLSPWRHEPTCSSKGPCSSRLVRVDFELTAIDSNFRVSAESVWIFHHSIIERGQVCESLSFLLEFEFVCFFIYGRLRHQSFLWGTGAPCRKFSQFCLFQDQEILTGIYNSLSGRDSTSG